MCHQANIGRYITTLVITPEVGEEDKAEMVRRLDERLISLFVSAAKDDPDFKRKILPQLQLELFEEAAEYAYPKGFRRLAALAQ